MKAKDFTIGVEFKCGERHWRCTDVGSRVVAAICVDNVPRDRLGDSSWLNGPPYAVPEILFDEYDLPGCEIVNATKASCGVDNSMHAKCT